MRRALAWFAGVVGLAALVRALRRRGTSRPSTEPAVTREADDPATELRRRLDEARTAAEEPAEPVSAEDAAAGLAERRARVHARAQEALDLMREPPETP